MSIYVNRVLNMKAIKAVGFDMDYTLVRYNTKAFEELTYSKIVDKLILFKNYPEVIKKFKFNFDQSIRGLVVDKVNGNLIKLSLWGKIKKSCHGTKNLDFKTQQHYYRGQYVDLSDPNYAAIDTSFSIAYACMIAQLVDLKDSPQGHEYDLPSYEVIEEDVLEMMDLSHRDGSLKSEVVKDLDKYIIKDPECVEVLERLKQYGKKVIVATNSEYEYTRSLLDYAINPYLKNHKCWQELFEITITLAAKPRFFTDNMKFLRIDPETGLMNNVFGKIGPGIYQGGSAEVLQESLDMAGEEILYIGDHIYGDILTLKKTCNWRTALVVEELSAEVEAHKKSIPIIEQIDQIMEQKVQIERKLDDLYALQYEQKQEVSKDAVHKELDEIDELDKKLRKLIKEHNDLFSNEWGEIMRAGQEESRFAGQVQKYACIYMSKVSDFIDYSPRTYFRPVKRILPHEIQDRKFE